MEHYKKLIYFKNFKTGILNLVVILNIFFLNKLYLAIIIMKINKKYVCIETRGSPGYSYTFLCSILIKSRF